VVRVPGLRDRELPPSYKPSEHAPGRRARHRAHGCLEKRLLALRKKEANHAIPNGGATAGIASMLEFLPDQFRKATALCDSFLDIAEIRI